MNPAEKQPPSHTPSIDEGQGARYVAVCDLLGFSRLTRTMPLSELVQDFKGLLGATGRSVLQLVTIAADGQTRTVQATVFSDTLLFWSIPIHSDGVLDLVTVSSFFDAITNLIAVGLLNDRPIRVGVAFGETYMSAKEGIFLGEPIVAAYETEQSQNWIGGACHSSCENAPHFRTSVCDDWNQAVKYDIPLHQGRTPMWALNWFRRTAILVDPDGCRNYLQNKSQELKAAGPGVKYSAALEFLTHLETSEPYASMRSHFEALRKR